MTSAAAEARTPGSPGFREIMMVREYQAMWVGQTQSVIGDQVARIAPAVLVYDRTHSPLLTAVTYAGSFLPWLVGGLVLAALVDRWPRRTVLVACDLARGVLVTVIASPGLPLPVMIALLYFVTLLDGPFIAARGAAYRDILPDDRYRLGVTIATTTLQLATVAGSAAGGILVSVIGARPALIIDAATFAVSALLIRLAITGWPAAGAEIISVRERVRTGVKLVFTDRRLRTCMFLGWLAALYSVPSALAVPLAVHLGGGSAAAGLIFAATPSGIAAGTVIYGRAVRPAAQTRWMGAVAAACCGSLALFLAKPGLAWSLVILVISGALAGYQVAANTNFVQALRRDQQTQAFGIATAGIWTIQGIAFLAAGAMADRVTPSTVIAAFGIAGAIAALALAIGWRSADTATGRHDPAEEASPI